MKTYVRKPNEIKVAGIWTGGEDELTAWLSAEGIVYKIQTEDPEQVNWRTKPRFGNVDPDTTPRTQLVVVGDAMHDEAVLAPGSALVVDPSGRLSAWDVDMIEEQYDEVV